MDAQIKNLMLLPILFIVFMGICIAISVIAKRSGNENFKKFTSMTLNAIGAIIAAVCVFLFLTELFDGDYKSYSHWLNHLFSPLTPVSLSVAFFYAGRYVSGKSKGYTPFMYGLATLFLWIFIIKQLDAIFPQPTHWNEAYEWAQKWKTTEETRSNLEGTIWTYTSSIEKDDMFNKWCKLEFKNGKLYYYEVSPSDGDWGKPQVCDYTVEERRYSNTGERYIGVFWEALLINYLFIPTEKSISYQGRNGYVHGAYLTMEDAYPWH